eukprot:scaffold16540_cov26-Attheya_sp.AAC.2
MAGSILHLRVRGSKTPKDFLDALHYYSLWNFDYQVTSMLLNKAAKIKEMARLTACSLFSRG